MDEQVYLGGACGRTTWRERIAIPLLEDAGVAYHNPQLPFGQWSERHEAGEMEAKLRSSVLLWVIGNETRGVASVAEAAYYLVAGQPLALDMTFLPESPVINGQPIGAEERDDLNRGRMFVRTMAAVHGVPVHPDVAGAVRHAITLISTRSASSRLHEVRAVLADVRFKDYRFFLTPAGSGIHLQVRGTEIDRTTGQPAVMHGRRWLIGAHDSPSEIVRTAFLAVLTWQEHEARESFTYKGASVFGPHLDVDDLRSASWHEPIGA